MMQMFNRRQFLVSGALAAGAAALGGCATPWSVHYPRRLAANAKLNVGIIGCGGKGGSDLEGVAAAGENIVALCDVDQNYAAHIFKKYPKAKQFTDSASSRRSTMESRLASAGSVK